MTRLAMFMANLEGGGAERMMVHLAAGLADRGMEVELVLAHARGPYLAEVPGAVSVVDLKRRSVSAAILPLARYLRRAKPDVLLATLRHVSLAAAVAHAAARSDALLFLREANTPSRRSSASSSVKTRAVDLLMRWAYTRAVRVLAVSEGVATDLVRTQGVPSERVVTVYNPVVTADIAVQARANPGHPWLVPGSPPVVLAAGSLQHKKDFATLIAAFARVRATRPARLIILGEGPLRADLERQVRELRLADDVDLPGFVANPFAFMARASVFVLSSVLEGLPGVLIQALACGCPVVATDCPSGPYEILEGGRFGELVPMRDPGSLAAAIDRSLDAPVDRMALRLRSEVYASDRVVAVHHDLLERIARSRRGVAMAGTGAPGGGSSRG